SEESGFSVSGAGDVNGDGLADLIVGCPKSDAGSSSSSWDAGRRYGAFGKTTATAIELTAVAAGTGGFVINGAGASDGSGSSVSSVGDINGDGMADLVVGAPNSDPSSGVNAGRSYVIFGKTDGAAVHLADVQQDLGQTLTCDWLGSSASETWTGTSASEWAVGGAGDDTLIGGGGTDVIYGGAGQDTITLNPSNIAELSRTGPSLAANPGRPTQFSRIDGGGGMDTLRLSDGASLDLTGISNVAAGNFGLGSRLASIERIDLSSDTSANTLSLSAQDLLVLCGMNLFNTGNGWTNGTGSAFGNSVARHQLAIKASFMDRIDIDLAVWIKQTSAGAAVTVIDAGTTTYEVWNHNTKALQLLIQQGAQVI
ncbi:MAG: hypothetical protein FGM28_12970, partial [Limnohabitans sp.]|nr:hypothetical protein [Limnohabitans sp.]